MTTYKETFGKQIKQVSSDPTDAGAEGQIWFNTTEGSFRSVLATGGWVSGGNLNRGTTGAIMAGSQTASIIAGGYGFPTSPGGTNNTESYNGSSWTNVNNMNDGIGYSSGVGTQTAALAFGGSPSSAPYRSALNESWNGTSWSEVGDLVTATMQMVGTGTQTAALAIGGGSSSSDYATTNQIWNGSSWSEGSDINTGRAIAAGGGTSTASIIFGGQVPGAATAVTETWDGSSWTNGNSMNTARQALLGAGSPSAAVAYGGTIPPSPGANTTQTEEYNGTSWSIDSATLAAGRSDTEGCGTGTAAITAGGNPTPVNATSTTTLNAPSIYSPIAATWASGGAYPTAILQLGGAGTQTAGLGFGGNGGGGNPNGSVISAEYNGSSWTSSGDLNQKGNTGSRTGVGTQTAALCVARRNDGTPSVSPVSYIAMNNVEEYNGSAWSNSPTLPAATVESGSTGTTVAALYFGGSPGNPPAGLSGQSLYWNDTSWTATPSLNTSRAGIMSAFQGTYNASLGFGGSTGAPAYGVTNTELYNGSSWTNLAVMLEQKNRGSGHGTSTAALAAAGQNPSTTTNTQIWDGSSWATTASTATAQYFQGGGGSSTAAVIFAGADPSAYTTATQEFTGEQQALDYKTLTSS